MRTIHSLILLILITLFTFASCNENSSQIIYFTNKTDETIYIKSVSNVNEINFPIEIPSKKTVVINTSFFAESYDFIITYKDNNYSGNSTYISDKINIKIDFYTDNDYLKCFSTNNNCEILLKSN